LACRGAALYKVVTALVRFVFNSGIEVTGLNIPKLRIVTGIRIKCPERIARPFGLFRSLSQWLGQLSGTQHLRHDCRKIPTPGLLTDYVGHRLCQGVCGCQMPAMPRMSTIVAITFTGTTDSQELGKDTSDVDNFNDVFGNLNRYVFQVLPWG
jgi:hypothetical protein